MALRVSSTGDMNDMILCLHNFPGEFVNLLSRERLVYYVYDVCTVQCKVELCITYDACTLV